MTIESITPSKWVNILNSEAHPNLTHSETRYFEISGMYAVWLYTGLGSFISQTTCDRANLDSLEKELQAKYARAKDSTITEKSGNSFLGLTPFEFKPS